MKKYVVCKYKAELTVDKLRHMISRHRPEEWIDTICNITFMDCDPELSDMFDTKEEAEKYAKKNYNLDNMLDLYFFKSYANIRFVDVELAGVVEEVEVEYDEDYEEFAWLEMTGAYYEISESNKETIADDIKREVFFY